MYYPYFIAYVILGFCISLMVFVWALGRGQFRDQERARYLPLEEGEAKETLKVSRFNRYEAYGLAGLVVLGLMATGAVLVFALFFGGARG
jgi:nitrogen fixation-related uncharacterized protein